jgi:hypothetical protein
VQSLEQLDQSIPLPDTATCIAGFRHVLRQAVDHAVDQLLKQCNAHRDQATTTTIADVSHFRNQIRGNAQDIWLRYLRTWSDAAQQYGNMYPFVRFCFRDFFLDKNQAYNLLRVHLPYRIDAQNLRKYKRNTADTTQDDDHPSEADQPRKRKTESSGPKKRTKRTKNNETSNDAPNAGNSEASAKRNPREHSTRLTAIRLIVNLHTKRRRKNSHDCALVTPPSMIMVAAITWLAILKQRTETMSCSFITSSDVCHWIETGAIPLYSAFGSLLASSMDKRLCESLLPVASFFRLDRPITTDQIERTATLLCVVCRLRQQSIITDHLDDLETCVKPAYKEKDKDIPLKVISNNESMKSRHQRQQLRFWSLRNLPRILAGLVAQAGLGQDVLDRTLALVGLKKVFMSQDKQASTETEGKSTSTVEIQPIPVVRSADQLTTIEELLALIAIACQLDPEWRKWQYVLPKDSQIHFVPWNESEFRLLRSGSSLESYLDFSEEVLYPDHDHDHENAKNNGKLTISMLPKEYFAAIGGSLANERTMYKHLNLADQDTRCITANDHVLAGYRISNGVDPSSWVTRPKHMRGQKKSIRNAECNNASSMEKSVEKNNSFTVAVADFSLMDKTMNDWTPMTSPDADQNRLIEFLGFTALVDPKVIRLSMGHLLGHVDNKL